MMSRESGACRDASGKDSDLTLAPAASVTNPESTQTQFVQVRMLITHRLHVDQHRRDGETILLILRQLNLLRRGERQTAGFVIHWRKRCNRLCNKTSGESADKDSRLYLLTLVSGSSYIISE